VFIGIETTDEASLKETRKTQNTGGDILADVHNMYAHGIDVLAGFIIGFAERFTDTYIGSHWTMIVSLAAILLVLAIKPSGLFGQQKELEERI
jgi:hypothetical protein